MANVTIPDLTAATLPISRAALVELSVAGASRHAALNTVGEWDVEIVKSSDQTVTNNATPQNDSELVTALSTNSLYQVEFILVLSANDATGDFRGRFSIPAMTAGTGAGRVIGVNASNTIFSSPLYSGAAQWPSADVILAGDAPNTIYTSLWNFVLRVEGAAGNLQWQFANSAAAAGRTSTTRAGSTLRVRKLYP